jgi:hypothetical protein
MKKGTIKNIIIYKVTHSLSPLSKLIIFVTPIIMYWIGRGQIKFDAWIILPIFLVCIASIIRRVSNRIGKGDTFPVPKEKFTSVDEDGNPSIEAQRIHELILYVADVEEWLQKKGYIRE